MSEFEAHIAQIEDEIFSDFCSRIQVANIREYESSQLRGAQELNEKQLNFKTQRSKVENQLLFERQQLQELQERVSRLESVLNTDTGEIEAKNAEKEEYIAKLQKIEDNIAKIEAQVTNLKTKEDEQEKLVEERRKSLSQKGQEADQMIKHLSDVETSIEKLHAERMSIFRRCKLEDIDIPLNQGSMEDVPMDDSEVRSFTRLKAFKPDVNLHVLKLHDTGDAMDLDEPSQMSMASSTWSIAVNYSSLTTYLKDNADGSIEDDFQNKIRDLSQTLDEMAPNLKAVDRLEGVESRLKQTEGQFEKARKAAKRAKEKFTAVKQKR